MGFTQDWVQALRRVLQEGLLARFYRLAQAVPEIIFAAALLACEGKAPVKILIVSDLHGNLEAVAALPRDFDQLIVLGDLVNYGPNPREVIDFVRQYATLVVRGNHDHAIGFDADPQCAPPFHQMAAEMGRITRTFLSDADRAFLRGLPLAITTEVRGIYFHLCHAAPSGPLFAYRPPEASEWRKEAHAVSAGYLLVGHSHLQFRRDIDSRHIINPGSLGQPKSSAPLASFAIWEDGVLSLHSVAYDFEKTIAKLERLDISPGVKRDLTEVLRTGQLSARVSTSIA